MNCSSCQKLLSSDGRLGPARVHVGTATRFGPVRRSLADKQSAMQKLIIKRKEWQLFFAGFERKKVRAEVKRLLPEWGIRTGSKSYMRIQFILYGNKSFISV